LLSRESDRQDQRVTSYLVNSWKTDPDIAALPEPRTLLLFTRHLTGVFVLPQPHKFRMPQMTVRRPLRELDLHHQLGFEPPAISHFLFR
jgi:hypothetical protein